MPSLPENDECRVLRELRNCPELFERLAEAKGTELQIQQRLRREFPGELVRAVLGLQELRQRAARKFLRSDRMWFDRKGLEQATPEVVARHKAQRFDGPVVDLCCGIGGDTLSLAALCDVTAVDVDPAACLRTAWNGEAYEVQDRCNIVCRDAEQFGPFEGLVHVDPDRRPADPARPSRVTAIEECRPGLEFLRHLTQSCTGGAIKLSPAANFGGKFENVEIELVSVDGECKEATVWFGQLAEPGLWRATVLPSGQSIAGNPLDAYPQIAPPQRFLFDPDPAVVRAGLVDLLAERCHLTRLDDAEEYLTSDIAIDSDFVRTFEVLDVVPNNNREIRRAVRRAGFGQVEIKCRHIRVDVDAVRRKLPLDGDRPGVLIFARVQGKAHALVCQRPARGC